MAVCILLTLDTSETASAEAQPVSALYAGDTVPKISSHCRSRSQTIPNQRIPFVCTSVSIHMSVIYMMFH